MLPNPEKTRMEKMVTETEYEGWPRKSTNFWMSPTSMNMKPAPIAPKYPKTPKIILPGADWGNFRR